MKTKNEHITDNSYEPFSKLKSVLTDTEYQALHQPSQMTQTIYDSIIEKVMLLIPSQDEILFQILQDPQYSDFMIAHGEKIAMDLSKKKRADALINSQIADKV